MLRLFIVRHGVTIWNSEGRLQGHTDVPLSEEGLAQADMVAYRLSGEKLNAVYSSDLQRAKITGEKIAALHGLSVHMDPILRETMLGEWEGMTRDEIMRSSDETLFKQYRLDPMAYRPPGAEPLEQVWERMLAALQMIRDAHPQGSVAVVGHGGSLRVLLCSALGAPINSLRKIWLDNVSVSLIEYAEDRAWVRLMNDTCHLHSK